MGLKKHIPNLLTCCNLACGSVGIVKVFNNELHYATYFIWAALIFDFFDGFVARLLKVHSPMGKELDSLADMVTFGVLPGAISFQMLNNLTSLVWLPYAGFLITIFSALRLAKFNIDERQTDSFIGLPTPANTLFISSLIFVDQAWLTLPVLLSVIVVFSSLLVAPLEMLALKFKHFVWQGNEVRYIFIGISLVSILLFWQLALPVIIIAYICLSIIKRVFFSTNS
ncbi:MAG: CDP-diacylglycerol--serine O-phosphatidyltransferase, partial [Bacteroidota bacterium]